MRSNLFLYPFSLSLSLSLCDVVSRTEVHAWEIDTQGVCVCASRSSDAQVMGPRRKASKLLPQVGSDGRELVMRPSEPKDYINELSHEVLCHIFRYTTLESYYFLCTLQFI